MDNETMREDIAGEGAGVITAVDVAIFDKQGRILLGRRLAKAGYGSWGFPGGHLRTNEKMIECARREISEELGNEISVDMKGEILAVRENCIAPHRLHHLTVIIKGDFAGGEIKINEPEKCEKWKWFELNELPTPLFSGVEGTLKNYTKGNARIVTDW